MDGRSYVAKETEPYIQYWLDDRYRLLHAMFATRRGAIIDDAIKAYLRLVGRTRDTAERRRALKAIADMRRAEVLVAPSADASRYTAHIVTDYVAHRPFPRAIADQLVHDASIQSTSRVLDLAGGPGDLALALARHSNDVSLMELSNAFLKTAVRRAYRLGVSITPIHESCNRLVYQDDTFNVVTVSQALHWLDDVQVVRGVCRILRASGSFFVIHTAIDLADEHPFSDVLGRHSIFGHKPDRSFGDEVAALATRLTLLFDAIDAPDVHRVDLAQRFEQGAAHGRIVPVRASLFRQQRPFGLGYIRGFLTDAHIGAIGREPSMFWTALEARAATVPTEATFGTHHWAVLQFTRGGVRAAGPVGTAPVTNITFEVP